MHPGAVAEREAGDGTHPEYGPRGHLPERAARRARKIVLREQLGIGWITASLVAGALLVATGIVFLLSRTGPPGAPFVEAVALDRVPTGTAVRVEVDATPVVVARAGGGLRAFVAPREAVGYCPDSGRLEGADGSVWTLDGRLVGGPGDSLAVVPARAHTGTVYVDPTTTSPPLAAHDLAARPECETPP